MFKQFCFIHRQEPETEERNAHPKQLKQLSPEEKPTKRHSRSRHANENAVHQSHIDKKDNAANRRSRKRRSTEKVSATMVSKMYFLPLCNFSTRVTSLSGGSSLS